MRGMRSPAGSRPQLGFSAGLLALAFFAFPGCANLPFVKINKGYTRLFVSDFATAWTAALEGVSAGRSDVIRVNNRETGVIETGWIDNSESRQFLDVFRDEDFFLRMRYRLQVQVREGKKNDEQAVLIRVLKQQQQQATFMGGFTEVESDGVEENVYLYRIGRLIALQQENEPGGGEPAAIRDDGDTLF